MRPYSWLVGIYLFVISSALSELDSRTTNALQIIGHEIMFLCVTEHRNPL